VPEVLSIEFRGGLPIQPLYADDLVFIAQTEERLVEKIQNWKKSMEKGLNSKLR